MDEYIIKDKVEWYKCKEDITISVSTATWTKWGGIVTSIITDMPMRTPIFVQMEKERQQND